MGFWHARYFADNRRIDVCTSARTLQKPLLHCAKCAVKLVKKIMEKMARAAVPVGGFDRNRANRPG
jgi:hypothetical protein